MVSTSKRRRFQAPITSFFTTESLHPCDASGSLQAQQHGQPPSSSHLPHEIQSSLLTVGMRIRKSVPEGYKTHKTLQSSHVYDYPGYFLRSGTQDHNFATLTTVPSTTRAAYAELAPFCGLHKVGGMAVQPLPVALSGNHGHVPSQRGAAQVEEPNPWSLPSSQESRDSLVPFPPSNKRTFTSDGDEEDEDDFETGTTSQERSTYPFSHTTMPSLNTPFPTSQLHPPHNNNANTPRPFAIPRSRLSSNKEKKIGLEGQENHGLTPEVLSIPASVISASESVVDFEDAEFLAAREDVDIDNLMEIS